MIKASRIFSLHSRPMTIAPSYSRQDEFFVGDGRGAIHRFIDGNYTQIFENSDKTTSTHSMGLCTSRNFFAAVYTNKTLAIYNLQTNHVSKITNHQQFTCPRISPDESLIVAGSYDYKCYVYNTSLGRIVLSYDGHEGWVMCIAFSATGNEIFSGGIDRTVHKWNVQTGDLIVKTLQFKDYVKSIDVSRDIVAVGLGQYSKNIPIAILDANTLSHLHSLEGHTDSIMCLVFSPDGFNLVSGSLDGKIFVWNVQKERKIAELDTYKSFSDSMCFSLDGRTFVCAPSYSITFSRDMLAIYNNFPLSIFLAEINCNPENVKTVQSFFYTLKDYFDPLLGFNSEDTDNYFLMRILCNL